MFAHPIASSLRCTIHLARRGVPFPSAYRKFTSPAPPAGFPGAPASRYAADLSESYLKPSDISIPTYRAVDHEGRVLDQTADSLLEDEALRKVWTNMVTIRAFDEIMYKLQRQGLFSFFMSTFGEESSLFGLGEALRPGDVVFGQYREQALLLHLGKSVEALLQSYFATRGDDAKGRQMPQTMGLSGSNAPIKFVTMKASLGEQIPQAAGSAYALKLAGKRNVVACVMGDGCTSEGDFAVGLNMAATSAAPVIFFVRNNGFAISTPAQGQQYTSDGIAPRGPAYGMPSIRVDGTDLAAVHRACTIARDHCLDAGGPFLIEAMTCRLGPHSTSDEQTTYRNQADIDAGWQKFDCVERLRKYLVVRGLGDVVEQFTKEQAAGLVLAAIKQTEMEKPPYLDWLFDDVFAGDLEGRLAEQKEELRQLMRKWGAGAWGADPSKWEWKDGNR